MARRIVTPVEVAKVIIPKKPKALKVVPDTSGIELLQQANIELHVWNSKLQEDLEFMTSMSHKLSKMNTALFLCNMILSASFVYFYFY